MDDHEAADKDRESFSQALLRWYDGAARKLPWRVPPGAGRLQDPYLVLVSETMLQQTTVATVKGRYDSFVEAFPNVRALANAPEEAVLAAWAGLGYYRRARSLHACAKAVASQHGGVFPTAEKALLALPGIGPYTAAAIRAIAFGERSVVIDTNVERIVARVACIETPLPAARKAIAAAAEARLPDGRYEDYAQAMMDLGAMVCRPKAPDCPICPVRSHCLTAGSSKADKLPVRAAKKARVKAEGVIAVLRLPDGRIVAADRSREGLFGGMLGLPGGGWDGSVLPSLSEGLSVAGSFVHILTHRELSIRVLVGQVGSLPDGMRAVAEEEARASMPTLFKKALNLART